MIRPLLGSYKGTCFYFEVAEPTGINSIPLAVWFEQKGRTDCEGWPISNSSYTPTTLPPGFSPRVFDWAKRSASGVTRIVMR